MLSLPPLSHLAPRWRKLGSCWAAGYWVWPAPTVSLPKPTRAQVRRLSPRWPLGGEKVLVVLNFSSEKRAWPLPPGLKPNGPPLLNNYPALAVGPALALQPWQAVVIKI